MLERRAHNDLSAKTVDALQLGTRGHWGVEPRVMIMTLLSAKILQ